MQEVWLPVVGWEGLYEVSDQGRVRSLDRTVAHPRSGSLRIRGRLLKPCQGSHGYYSVNFCKEGIATVYLVHRLIAEAFIGPCPEGEEVRHGSSNRTDNRACNLCYGTRKENAADKERDGTLVTGERHGQAKLTEVQVRYAKQQLKSGVRGWGPRLARELQVSAATIQAIKEGRNWAWLEP